MHIPSMAVIQTISIELIFKCATSLNYANTCIKQFLYAFYWNESIKRTNSNLNAMNIKIRWPLTSYGVAWNSNYLQSLSTALCWMTQLGASAKIQSITLSTLEKYTHCRSIAIAIEEKNSFTKFIWQIKEKLNSLYCLLLEW